MPWSASAPAHQRSNLCSPPTSSRTPRLQALNATLGAVRPWGSGHCGSWGLEHNASSPHCLMASQSIAEALPANSIYRARARARNRTRYSDIQHFDYDYAHEHRFAEHDFRIAEQSRLLKSEACGTQPALQTGGRREERPLHCCGRADRGWEDDARTLARRGIHRPHGARAGRREPFSTEVLRGTHRLRIPGPAVLPPQPLPPATAARAAGPIQPEHRRGLPLCEGLDLRPGKPRVGRAGALSTALRAPRFSLAKTRFSRVSSGTCRCPRGAFEEARSRL